VRKLRQKEIELDGQAGWCDVPLNDLQDKCKSLTARGMIVTAIDVERAKPLHPGCYRIYYVPKANTYTYDEREKHIPETSTAVPDTFVRHINTDVHGDSGRSKRRKFAKQLELI
jgi:hypothetical protein